VLATLQSNVDAVREAGGAPHVNHPNFGWAFDHRVLKRLRGARLFELHSGHPLVHVQGGGDSPGTEEMWDSLLTAGVRIYGVAVDDSHHFLQGEPSRERASPGRGWVVVRASRLDAAEIVSRLEAGDFYASTGVELEDVVVAPTRLEVRIKPYRNFKYRTEFIGSGGRVLLRTGANPAVLTLTGPERYVRARVVDSGGAVAWVQPVFVVRR
jgi:hypothetical protein